jgi:hypothetical protein
MNTTTLFHHLRRGLRASGVLAKLGAFRLLRVTRLAMATVEDVIAEEVRAGRVGPVTEKLKAGAHKLITDKLARRLVAAMLLRLGIESALASTVVGLILPFAVEYAIRRLGRTQAWARITAREDVIGLKDKIRARLSSIGQRSTPAPTPKASGA